MLDLVHVRSFVALAAELHFGRAAQRLNMTQPPLSRQIRLLEDYLGTRLFERTSQSVALTPAGRNFLPEAQALLQHAEDAEALAREVSHELEGQIRIGFYGSASFRFLPLIMARIAQVHPRLEVTLRELNAVEQVKAFSFGEIDLGLARPTAVPPGLRAETGLREPLLLALPLDHALMRKSRLTPADLHDQPFIAYGPEAPYMYALQKTMLAEQRIFPRIVQFLSRADAILSLVDIGMGLAIVPGHARHIARENLGFRSMSGLGQVTAVTHILTREDSRNPAIDRIATLVREVGQQLEAEARLAYRKNKL